MKQTLLALSLLLSLANSAKAQTGNAIVCTQAPPSAIYTWSRRLIYWPTMVVFGAIAAPPLLIMAGVQYGDNALKAKLTGGMTCTQLPAAPACPQLLTAPPACQQ
jgi:hypothetical protein